MTDSEDAEKVNKLDNKIKLSNLLTGKKFADFELKLGKFETKLNEFSADFTKIKEKTEDIEDVLNIINLGINEYKEKLEEIGSQLSGGQKIPEDMEKRMLDYENRLNSLITMKEELSKTVDKTFIQTVENLKKSSENNKLEMEYIKKDMDAFSSTIKSFERSLEFMNLDSLRKRFESVNAKIAGIQTQIQEFRDNMNNLSFSGEDVKVLKNQVNELISSLNDKFNKINEIEKSVEIAKQKTDDLNFFGKVPKGKENLIDEYKVRIDELTTRIDRLSNEVKKLSSSGKSESKENDPWEESDEPAEASSPDHAETEEIYDKVKEMYDEISSKFSELKDLEEKLKSQGTIVIGDTGELTPDVGREVAKINEKIVNIEKKHNELVEILQAELKEMKEFTPSEGGYSMKENFEEYRKQVDKRFKMIENRKFSGLPKDLIEELNLMKETFVRLSTENKELWKLAREIRVSQLESINLQTFNALSEKVGLLERKISEIEENMNKEFSVQTKRKEILENLKKEIEDSKKILEGKIGEIETSKDKIEGKISKIEKRLREEDIVKPIILE